MSINELYQKILNGDKISIKPPKNKENGENKESSLKKFSHIQIDLLQNVISDSSKIDNEKEFFSLFASYLKNNNLEEIKKDKGLKNKDLKNNNFFKVIKIYLFLKKYKDGDNSAKNNIFRILQEFDENKFPELISFIKELERWSRQ